MIYCSVKYCSNSSIPGVILHSIMKSIKTPNHPAYHWSTLWPLKVWVRGLYNSWWFCVHKLYMFIYLSMTISHPIPVDNIEKNVKNRPPLLHRHNLHISFVILIVYKLFLELQVYKLSKRSFFIIDSFSWILCLCVSMLFNSLI